MAQRGRTVCSGSRRSGGGSLCNLSESKVRESVIADFKDKTRYAPYVSHRSQISYIATNKG